MSRRRLIVGIIGVLVVVLIVIQFIPVAARTNPPVQSQIQWNTQETEQLARAACYDCHSNETVWPWYTQIAPVSWLVAKDVDEGREALNFSEQTATGISGEEAAGEIEEGAMPPRSYLLIHPAANLTAEQKATLIAGLEASLTGHEDDAGETDESDAERGENDESTVDQASGD